MPENALLRWTLDAKRALQHAEQLSSHANNLVSDSVAALDSADAHIPKCAFLRGALMSQLALLDRLAGGCCGVEEHARKEFEVFIKDLDSLDIDLNEILSRLKGVALDPGFDAVNPVDLRQNPPRKSLRDFVDEQGIEDLKAQLRQAIDEVQESHDILSSSLTTLSTEIKEMKSLIESIQPPTSLPPLSPSSTSRQRTESQTYATHPEKQDYHAHHLAVLLTSLAQHYDQTSSALKDYESHGHIQPTDPETLEILKRDAHDVSEVLEEMEDHVREIEHSSDTIQMHTGGVYETYTAIVNAFHQLETYGKERLPSHLSSVRDFEARADVHRQHIQTLKQEMFNLVQYYTNFSSAYTALVVEVRRRTETHAHTSLLVNEISAKLQSIYDQELRARQAFMDLHAAFLPQDLWTGITDPPTRTIVNVEEGGALPPLRDPVQRVGSAAAMERRRSGQVPMSGSGESSGRRSMDSTSRRSLESSGGRR